MVRFGIRVCFGLTILALLSNILLQNKIELVSASPQPSFSEPARKFVAPEGMPDPNKIFSLVNSARANSGLPPLQRNNALTDLAEQRANDMAANNYYAHKGTNGLFFDKLIQQNGFKFAYGCENLNLDFTVDPTPYVSAWIKSQAGHKECMLNPKVTDAGYAVTTVATVAGVGPLSYIVVAIHSTETLALSQ